MQRLALVSYLVVIHNTPNSMYMYLGNTIGMFLWGKKLNFPFDIMFSPFVTLCEIQPYSRVEKADFRREGHILQSTNISLAFFCY